MTTATRLIPLPQCGGGIFVQRSRTRHEPASRRFTGRWAIVIGILAGLAWLTALSQGLYDLHSNGLFGANDRGTIGLVATGVAGKPGWERIDNVIPDGAAARAGLSPGAMVRFDQPFLAHADRDTARSIGVVTMANGSPPRHVTLTPLPENLAAQPKFRRFARMSAMLTDWLVLALGTLAIVRGWGSPSALALGMGMLAYSINGYLPSWATEPALAAAFLVESAVLHLGSFALLLLPAVLYFERVGSPGRGWTVVLWRNRRDRAWGRLVDGVVHADRHHIPGGW